MSNDWYIVNDIETFINKTRILVFNSFGRDKNQENEDSNLDTILEKDQEEFDAILSYNDALLIAKEILRKQTNKRTHQQRFLVSDEIYYRYLNLLNQRMIGNILSRLVNKGLIETAFDDESNDFIFWVNDNEKKEKDPKTD